MDSNTGDNSPKHKGQFVKGDKRINRLGRPKNFDALRALALQIGHEPIKVGDRRYTVTEAILRQWAVSKNPKLQQAFIEIAYGKVPDKLEMTGKDGSKLRLLIVYPDDHPDAAK